MKLKINLLSFSIPIILGIVFMCVSDSSPISYREDTMEETSTANLYNDRVKLKKEYKQVLTNLTHFRNNHFKSGYLVKPRSKEEKKALYKAKSVMSGERTVKQKDEDDDDDDDGGEYEGLDYNGDEIGKKTGNKCSGKQDNRVPMMIIREVDMLAMQIPMQDTHTDKEKDKEQVEENKAEGKEWSVWSPCNKMCGDGLQSRWRYKSGVNREAEREQQFKPCHLADCVPQEYHHDYFI